MTRGAKADAGRAGAGGPGLPQTVTAGLFDLDAVLTNTAAVHHQAWTEMFDAFPRERAERTGEPFVAFDPVADYATYVDGKPRPDGVRDFLASRGITLPEGNPDDGPGMETVHGLGNRRNEALLRRIREQGVRVFEDALAGAEAGRAGGFVVGVDRTGHADALRTHGADIVAGDLAELLDGVAGEATR